MEKNNWIKAYLTIHDGDDERDVFVRQEESCSVYFVSDEGRRYHISELDLTRSGYEPQIFNLEEFEKRNKEIDQQYRESQVMYMDMLSKMDANSIADHKAKIDEREYWRKLRGEIFKMVFDATPDKGTMEGVLEYTKKYFDAIYSQDQEFFKDK